VRGLDLDRVAHGDTPNGIQIQVPLRRALHVLGGDRGDLCRMGIPVVLGQSV
jgi:hypothetical protein